MLFETLRKENIEAMKEKNIIKKNILGIVISKCQLVLTEKRGRGEELTDADCLSIIQKVIKEVEEEANAFKAAGRMEKFEELNKQKEIISGFLPKMLSKEEIIEEISKLEDKNIPTVMKYFKLNFAGKVDMGLVSQVLKEMNN